MSDETQYQSRFRMGSVIAMTGLILSFVLAYFKDQPTAFTVVGLAAVAGKWGEAMVQRHTEGRKP